MRRTGVLFLTCALVVAICSPELGVAEIAPSAGDQNQSDLSVAGPGSIATSVHRLKDSGPRPLPLACVGTLPFPRSNNTRRDAAHAPSTGMREASALPLAARAPPLV